MNFSPRRPETEQSGARLRRQVLRAATIVLVGISVVTPFAAVYAFGFPQSPQETARVNALFRLLSLLAWLALTVRLVVARDIRGPVHMLRGQRASKVSIVILYGIITVFAAGNIAVWSGLLNPSWLEGWQGIPWIIVGSLFLLSVVELSKLLAVLPSRKLNPPAILAVSFLLIIGVGSLLLMLPNSTRHGIDYTDALFTATSAVCVTGLSAVGSAADTFTQSGWVIILVLIQIGGLGVMTITSFFALFFMGRSTLGSQLLVGDMLGRGARLAGLGKLLVRIIAVTLTVELAGALLLFGAVDDAAGFAGDGERTFFAVFHSISAFCNAGISNLPGNLYDPAVRTLWSVPVIVSCLVIFGGIGFPIFSNFLSILGRGVRNLFLRVVRGQRPRHRARLLDLNSYIVLRTTGVLLAGAFIFVLFAEWNHSLAGLPVEGKLAQGFLAAATPRTAGFNGVDLASVLPATLVVTVVLMWIGGAPQSTAGGIKVTTAYVAVKNIFSTLRGGRPIEVHGREIPGSSVRRAFAVIGGSLALLFAGSVLLLFFEPGLSPGRAAFGAMSAFSTVGLDPAGITPGLSDASKMVLMVLMFIGRVGVLSALGSLVRRRFRHPYQLPREDILIN